MLTLKDAKGGVLEVIPWNVGFRQSEIKGESDSVQRQEADDQRREPPRVRSRSWARWSRAK